MNWGEELGWLESRLGKCVCGENTEHKMVYLTR